MRSALVRAASAALASAALASPAPGQTLAARIAAVREGTIHLAFAARPGLCGDGESVVRSGSAVYVLPDMFGRDRNRSDAVCYTGPVLVTIGRASGEIASIRVHVGGRMAPPNGVMQLGVVSAPEAARYFVSQAVTLPARNAQFAIIAAALADSVPIAADLARLARTASVRPSTRAYAVQWMGIAGGDDARRELRAMVTDAALGDELRGHAIVALAQHDIEPVDAQFLQARYASLAESLHDEVFLALSRSGDPRIQRWLVDRVVDAAEPFEMRKQALFWAGQGDVPMSALVALYPRLESTELRQHFTFVLSQRPDDDAVAKLIDIADHDASKEVRKQALFWLGQSKSPKARAFLLTVLQR